jgi:hypothetical protein
VESGVLPSCHGEHRNPQAKLVAQIVRKSEQLVALLVLLDLVENSTWASYASQQQQQCLHHEMRGMDKMHDARR